jgi:hypothetical protein
MQTENTTFHMAEGPLACRFDQAAFDDAMMRSKSAQKRREPEAAVAWLLIAEAISYLPASPASAQ